MSVYNFLVSGPNFTNLFAQEGMNVVDLVVFRFSTGRCVSETLAIKVESCQKLCRILDFFALLNFVGGTPCKINVNLIT